MCAQTLFFNERIITNRTICPVKWSEPNATVEEEQYHGCAAHLFQGCTCHESRHVHLGGSNLFQQSTAVPDGYLCITQEG